MKISLNWLKDFVDFDPKLSVEEIKWRLTEASAEIERVEHLGEGLDTVVVGELVETKKHPDADKLHVGQVKVTDKDTIQVIYGDKAEMSVGDKVPTAVAPTTLHGGEVKAGKIRGVESQGMLCLDSELIEGASGTLTKFDKSTKIGTPVCELLPLQDVVFEVDNHSITHRPDLFSHYGFARECVALGLGKWKREYPKFEPTKMVGKKKLPFSVRFSDKVISKDYHATMVTGLDTRPSPFWMQARLTACGIRAINSLVDITNYVMLEAGAPMHAFDCDNIKGNEFFFRFSKDDEKMTTLDGKERALSKDIIVVENDGKIIDLVGIMGAENTEVVDSTKSVFFHQGIYDPVYIRKAMITLGHRTDAGTIYEKGPEAELSVIGIARTLELTKEIFPDANFEYEMFHAEHELTKVQKIELTHAKLTSHLGIDISIKDAKAILESLGCEVKATKDKLTVTPPAWRAGSLTIPEDLVEEVARIHGYSKIPATIPAVELVSALKNMKRHLKRTVQKFLVGQGFHEELNFSFLSEEMLAKVDINDLSSILSIINPVTDDFRHMRPTHLPYMLQNLGRNQISQMKTWKSFELAKVYSRHDQKPHEELRLMALIAVPEEAGGFEAIKGLTVEMFDQLSLEVSFADSESSFAFPGRASSISHDGQDIGKIYELHPLFLDNFKLRGSVGVLDLDFEKLAQLHPEEVSYQKINRNPEALLDLSVVVDETTPMEEVVKVIESVQPEVLNQYELVGVYTGENIGKGKKSITFGLSYQHPERTLEEKEIQDILEELISSLEKSGATIRR